MYWYGVDVLSKRLTYSPRWLPMSMARRRSMPDVGLPSVCCTADESIKGSWHFARCYGRQGSRGRPRVELRSSALSHGELG